MEMPKVKQCTASDCGYNSAMTCHTPGITVGKGKEPLCDTYLKSELHGGEETLTAGVGACKIYMCLHNRDLACIAYAIKVGIKDGHPDCLTYKNRYK